MGHNFTWKKFSLKGTDSITSYYTKSSAVTTRFLQDYQITALPWLDRSAYLSPIKYVANMKCGRLGKLPA